MNPSLAFDAAVLVGHFQPFHRGQAALLTQALAAAPQVGLVLRDAFHARTSKAPFTWVERAALIAATLSPEELERVHFIPLREDNDPHRWATSLSDAVQAQIPGASRVALLGLGPEEAGTPRSLFPHWSPLPGSPGPDATSILQHLFAEEPQSLEALLPPGVATALQRWHGTPEWAALREEHVALVRSRETWGSGPFITLDALVRAADQVLLVRRGRHPGKGLWALPGGFLEPGEFLEDGARRELQEETGLDLDNPALGAALRGSAVFDHPARSLRGRTLTHVYHFDLDLGRPPEVRGQDDAAEARWFPSSALPDLEEQCFEDHFHILWHFLGFQPR